MKTASVRQVRQAFPRILEWIHAGEEVAITRRNQAVARLVPWRKKKKRRPMPDISARLRRVFGDKVIPDKTMKAIMDQTRGVF
jgi:antitoxin (DNA-binding transcriptional repressor) of toxin-antitoxin stability system